MHYLQKRTVLFDRLESLFHSQAPDDTAFYVVVDSRETYDTLVRLNQLHRHSHNWFAAPESTNSASECTVTLSELEQPDVYGAFRLSQPAYVHEKKRHHYTGAFLFGRLQQKQSFIDFAVDDTLAVNKVSFGIFQRPTSDRNWMIQCEGNDISVNGVRMNKSCGPFAFHPAAPNLIRLKIPITHLRKMRWKSIDLEFHFNPDFEQDVSIPLLSDLRVKSLATGSSSRALTIENLGTSERREKLYMFKEMAWKKQNREEYNLVMDPWTCNLYIAKPCNQADLSHFERRKSFFDALRVSHMDGSMNSKLIIQHNDAFIMDERISKFMTLDLRLSRFREEAQPLSEYADLESTNAIPVLLELLDRIATLHQAGWAHNNIGAHSILLEGQWSLRPLIAGFSKCSPYTRDKALEDCKQILRCVEVCFVRSQNVGRNWTGCRLLHNLLADSSSVWPVTVEELRHQLKELGFWKAKNWRTIRASKIFKIRYCYRSGFGWLHAEDVINYTIQLAIAQMTSYDHWPDSDSIDSFVRQQLLNYTDESGYFHLAFLSSLDKRISQRLGVRSDIDLALRCRRRVSQSSILTMKIMFHVPFNDRYGIINLKYLSRAGSKRSTTMVLPHLLSKCLHIRGDPRGQGTYIPVEDFSTLFGLFDLSLEETLQPMERDKSIDHFTAPDWDLFSPHGYSDLFPYNRKSEMVTFKSGRQIPMVQFLGDYVPCNKWLDFDVLHPLSLSSVTPSPEVLHTGTMTSLSQDTTLSTAFMPG